MGLGLGGPGLLAYEGPDPVAYDRTVDTIRVVMTAPGKLLQDGLNRFALIAYVPIDITALGYPVDVEIRASIGSSTVTLARCTYVPQGTDNGTTVAVPCNRDVEVPPEAGSGSASVYPYVLRRASGPGGQRIHDGSPFGIAVPIIFDDVFENNGSLAGATRLGTVTSASYSALVSRDADYYRFSIPATLELATIGLAFWHAMADLDLWVYDASGQVVAVSDSYDDGELVALPVIPGSEYVVRVVNFSDRPAFYDLQIINRPLDGVHITSGPTGSPNPTAPDSIVALVVDAIAGDGSQLAFDWGVVCPGLPSNGQLSVLGRTAYWRAPANATGVQRACAVSVTARNDAGQSDSAGTTLLVDAAHDGITILLGPAGSPNPVASGGQATLGVTAADSAGHPLGYEWRSSCPLSLSGTFVPDAFVSNPTWIAPLNPSGTAMSCTIEVAVFDAFQHRETASYVQAVARADVVTVISGPSATPNPVESAGSAALSVAATDSHGHAVAYFWSAQCPLGASGSFAPSRESQNPTWMAPTNVTGLMATCTVTVRATDEFGNSATRSFLVLVNSIPDVIVITAAGLLGVPGAVPSGGGVPMAATATDSIGHTVSGSWRAVCPSLPSVGTFVLSPDGMGATWQAPSNLTPSPVACVIEVTVADAFGHSATASFEQVVDPAPHTLSFAQGPDGVPHVVPSEGPLVTALAAVDSHGHPLTFEWGSSCPLLPDAGAFGPSHLAQTPTWLAPKNLTGALQTCTLRVTARDNQGLSLVGSFDVRIDLSADVVTVTSAPVGVPGVVASGGTAALSVAASDPYGHPLTYSWQSVCAALGGSGTFNPASPSPTPTWSAPENRTGGDQTCTLTVTVTDTFAHSATAAVTIRVNSVPDAITVESGPSGSSDLVQSGTLVPLSLSATDSLNHALQYLWWVTCPALAASGSFVPNPNVRQPTWAAPTNRTGSEQVCTLNVKIADGRGVSVTRSLVQRVESVPHSLEITEGPHAMSSVVTSRGAVEIRTEVYDSLLHQVEHRWQAACPAPLGSGWFAPSFRGTVWNAPANLTGIDQGCELTLTVMDQTGDSITASLTLFVQAAVDQVTITAGPSSSANPAPSGGLVTLDVTAEDPFEHPLNYAWSASCPQGLAGEFSPSAFVRNPNWRAPANATGAQLSCMIRVTVTDGHQQSATGSFVQSVQPPNTITITFGPGGPPTAAEPESSLTLLANATNSLGRTLTYAWRSSCPGLSSTGDFTGATSATPVWRVPANVTGAERACTITVTVTDSNGEQASRSFDVRVAAQNTVAISQPANSAQNPVASGGSSRLQVVATDTQGRALSYLWGGTCAGLSSGGSFDNSGSPSPFWTAPVNSTGADVTCELRVTVANDRGQSRASTLAQIVTSLPQSLSFTSGPSGAPNPVVSSGLVQLSIAVTDVWSRPIAFAWSVSCPALAGTGAFDNASSGAPRWTAPANDTGSPQLCTLTASAADDRGHTTSRSLSVTVGNALQISGTSTGSGGPPNAVSPGDRVNLTSGGGALPGQSLTHLWTAVCPGLGSSGTFTSPGTATSTWVPPSNFTGSPQTCTLTLTTSDGQGQTQAASLTIVVQSSPAGTCTWTAAPMRLDVPSAGGDATIAVNATDGCPRSAASPQPWIRFTSGADGSGPGSVAVRVDATSAAGPRTGTITIAGVTVQVVQAGLGYTYYLAEGATIGGFFDTRVALLNPDPTRAASVTVDFQLRDSATVLTHTLVVGAHQRATIDVKTLGAVNPALAVLASAEFSTVVRSDVPLVVDRTMMWDTRAYGGHSETAVDAPASTWYFAEGATIGNFELYYLIQNPNAVPLDNEIEVTYLLPPPAAPIVRTYSMGANTRRNIAVHLEPGLENAEVSAIIRTPGDKPVIAERAMYLTTGDLFYGAGHESAGIRAPGTQWFFAEGATGDFFDLFILIGNPNDAAARVTATFLFDDGTTCSKAIGNSSAGGSVVVGPKSRQNVWVDIETVPGCPRGLAHAAVSTTITSDLPIVAERTMWWPGPTAATWAESHNSPGATGTGTLWAVADGEQGGSRGAETYVLVANASPFDGSAKVTLYFEDGTSIEKVVELLANSRTTVPIGAGRDPVREPLNAAERAGFGFGPIALDRRFGVVVESLPVPGQSGPAALVVERASYWNAPGAALWAAGTNALGTRLR